MLFKKTRLLLSTFVFASIPILHSCRVDSSDFSLLSENVWTSDNPYITLNEPEGLSFLYINDEKISIHIGFDVFEEQVFLYIPDTQEEILKGTTSYKSNVMTFKIVTDNIYDGKYSEIKFVMEEKSK